jgi:hypothetical protein
MADSETSQHVVVRFGRPVTEEDLEVLRANDEVLEVFTVGDIDIHFNGVHIDWDGIDGVGPVHEIAELPQV